MPCHWIKLEDGTIAHIRTSGHRRAKCHKCGKPSDFLCDFPMHRTIGGDVLKTCDRNLCSSCTNKGISPDKDFCDEHYPIAKAAYERRKQQELFSHETNE